MRVSCLQISSTCKAFWTRVHECVCARTQVCEDQNTISGVSTQVTPTLKLYLLILVAMHVQCGGLGCVTVCMALVLKTGAGNFVESVLSFRFHVGSNSCSQACMARAFMCYAMLLVFLFMQSLSLGLSLSQQLTESWPASHRNLPSSAPGISL